MAREFAWASSSGWQGLETFLTWRNLERFGDVHMYRHDADRTHGDFWSALCNSGLQINVAAADSLGNEFLAKSLDHRVER